MYLIKKQNLQLQTNIDIQSGGNGSSPITATLHAEVVQLVNPLILRYGYLNLYVIM